MTRAFDVIIKMARIAGSNPTEDQESILVEEIKTRLPRHLWAEAAIHCGGDVYTDISMNLGEGV